jgi:hypothetical protein
VRGLAEVLGEEGAGAEAQEVGVRVDVRQVDGEFLGEGEGEGCFAWGMDVSVGNQDKSFTYLRLAVRGGG